MQLTYMGAGGCVNIFIRVVKKTQELVSPASVWSPDYALIREVRLLTSLNRQCKSIPKWIYNPLMHLKWIHFKVYLQNIVVFQEFGRWKVILRYFNNIAKIVFQYE